MAHPDPIHRGKTQRKRRLVERACGLWTVVSFAAPSQHLIEGSSTTSIDRAKWTVPARNRLAVWLPHGRRFLADKDCSRAYPISNTMRNKTHWDLAALANSLQTLATRVLAPGRKQPVIGAKNGRKDMLTTRDTILHVAQLGADGLGLRRHFEHIGATRRSPGGHVTAPWFDEFHGQSELPARAGYANAPMATDDLQRRPALFHHQLTKRRHAQNLKAATMATLADAQVCATSPNTDAWKATHLRNGQVA